MNKNLHHLEEDLPKAPPTTATATAAIHNSYTCREEGQSVRTYVLKMKSYLDQMEHLGYLMPLVLGVNLILTLLSKDYDHFILNYNMHGMGKTIPELHAMLKLVNKGMPKKALTILAIRQGQIQKPEPQARGNGKYKGKKSKLAYDPRHKIPPPAKKEHPAKDTDLISQEASGSIVEFDEIQMQDAQPSRNTSEHQPKVKREDVKSQTDVNPVYRFARIPQAPERYGFYVDDEEHELKDHREPTNYQAALSDPKPNKWLESINVKMQSMKDNQVWNLVDLHYNCKTVGSKCLFKKTDIDGNIHTYKARLVSKGFTQTYGVDYEETFSPIADIKAIRILIAITLFYDYEIWKIDVKTAFLNDRQNKDVYLVQPEGFVNPKHPRRACKIQRSIYRIQEKVIRLRVKNILKYLQNTKDMFLVCGGDSINEISVTCYTDAGWETDREDLQSQTGHAFMMNGGTVD
uniref:Reverse transcriptase Ty1/copia-type domain-containing protein n=1 Tax=Tanacetum cinerariifolium TaxID=118510 RepID=A0A6L2M2A1_TANCI|nr:hypothetical protein [Tanacetum cinerariifolium]